MSLLTLIPFLTLMSLLRYKYYSWLVVALQTLFCEYSKQSYIHMYQYICIHTYLSIYTHIDFIFMK